MALEARPLVAAELVNPWSFGLKVQGMQTSQPHSYLNSFVAASGEYRFLRTYTLAADISHMNYAKDLRNNSYEGVGDVGVSVADRELWVNRAYRLELKGTLGALVPTGFYSKLASMQYGAFQSLALKKSFSDRFSLSYTAGMTQYSWNYDSAYEDADMTIYNIQYRFVNRVNFAFDVSSSFHWFGGGSVMSYHTTGGEDFSALILFTSFSYDVNPVASLDFGVQSGYKRKEDPIIWNGPATSKDFLGAEGILIFVGTSFRI